jgi:hypothetical protein
MKKEDFRCPGQNTMFWKPDDIYDVTCPNCGRPVEFWKDDARRVCKCGHRFMNPKRDIGCLEWCKYAEKCMPEMFQGENLRALYRDRLLAQAKTAMGFSEAHIHQILEVLDFAEEILAGEGGEPKVVIAAVILGGPAEAPLAVRAGGKGRGQGDDPCEAAREVMAEVGTEAEVIDQVCRIIRGEATEAEKEEANRRIVSDAVQILKLATRKSLLDREALGKLIGRKIETETGRRLAGERLL